MAVPLTLAHEVVAVEAGFKDWAALKAAPGDPILPSKRAAATTRTSRCLSSQRPARRGRQLTQKL
jgi:hypothetical protein